MKRLMDFFSFLFQKQGLSGSFETAKGISQALSGKDPKKIQILIRRIDDLKSEKEGLQRFMRATAHQIIGRTSDPNVRLLAEKMIKRATEGG